MGLSPYAKELSRFIKQSKLCFEYFKNFCVPLDLKESITQSCLCIINNVIMVTCVNISQYHFVPLLIISYVNNKCPMNIFGILESIFYFFLHSS